MRETSNRLMKKRIITFAGILAATILCVGIGIGMLTKAADKIVIPDTVKVGRHTFTKEKPLKVLEIVPHEAHDELGPITTNSTGTVSWDSLVGAAPVGAENAEAIVSYSSDYINNYYNYCVNLLGSTGYKLYYKNKLTGTAYEFPWVATANYTINGVIPLKELKYDLKNLTPVLYSQQGKDQNNNPIYAEAFPNVEDSKGNAVTVRNFFGFMIFGDVNMEDKVEVVAKKANDVTKQDIDDADLVYIINHSHNTLMLDLYKKINNITDNSVPTKGDWQFGGLDLDAEVAMHLQVESTAKQKAMIIGHSSLGSGGSNISRLLLLQYGIDPDAFVMDFALDYDEANKKYVGNSGEFRVENGAIKIYLNVDEYYEYTLGSPLKNKVGIKELPFGATMFVDRKATGETGVKNTVTYGKLNNVEVSSYGYSPNGGDGGDGDGTMCYPAYNAGKKNDFLTRSTFCFNDDNSLTNQFATDKSYQEDYDKDGNYLGSYYGDALFKLDLAQEDLETPGVIEYILGAYGGGSNIIDIVDEDGDADIRVLEIEPAGVFRYFDTNVDDKKLVASWFALEDAIIVGSPEDTDANKDKLHLDIHIDHMSTNAFNGYVGDIRAEYDLVVLGAYNGDGHILDAADGGPVYNKASKGDANDKLYNNDLTERSYEKLMAYLRAQLPLVLDYPLYNRDRTVVENGAHISKMNRSTIKANLNSTTGFVTANYTYTYTDLSSSAVIELNNKNNIDTVSFVSKPNVEVGPSVNNVKVDTYDYATYNEATMNVSKSNLSNMVFTGRVNNTGAFRMKVYVDRDRDSIFVDDCDTEEAELLFFAVDENKQPLKDGGNYIGALCKLPELDANGNPIAVNEFANIGKTEYLAAGSDVNNDCSAEEEYKIAYVPVYDEEGKVTAWDVRVELALPESLVGYLAWKVEVTDVSSGRVNISNGAFTVMDTVKKTVNVLQIIDVDNNDDGKYDDNTALPYKGSNIELGTGSAFASEFDKISGIVNMNLHVDTLTKTQFNDIPNDQKVKYLNDYSMLVLGLSDNYGVYNGQMTINGVRRSGDLSQEALDAINYYIDSGKSVLFTHDSLSYKNTSNKAAGSEAALTDFTTAFKGVIGMQDGYSLTEDLWMRVTSNDYSLFKGVEVSGSTRNTNRVSRLNKGEITEYPFTITGDGIKGTIPVAPTHAQYFKLNLEDLKDLGADGVKSDDDKDIDDVVVWYTLDESSDYALSDYFSATGQDAINNYYVYSVGNITYSSAGHSEINAGQTAELRLFVNTFIRAILSGTNPPEVVYENAIQNGAGLYTQLHRGEYYPAGGTITESFDFTQLDTKFTYKVSDDDLVTGYGRLNQVEMFWDINENGKYDDGVDTWLCYVSLPDGSKKPVYSVSKPTIKSVVNGSSYDAELWTVLNEAGVSKTIMAGMANKLINNELFIGMVATDSRGSTGSASIHFVQRDLYYLD